MGYSNSLPTLEEKDGAWVLSYSTVDEKTGAPIGKPTYLKGTLREITFKLVESHRRALQLAERNWRRVLEHQKIKEQQRQNTGEAVLVKGEQ
jgi:hypothetical protein